MYDELLTLVKKRKLSWFGHISRSSILAKTNLQGIAQEKRRGVTVDTGRGGKTLLKSGQGWTLLAQPGQLKPELGGKG